MTGSAQHEVPGFVVALFAAAGVLLMGLAVPLMRRRVPPNAWYGVRLPATYADPAVWYEVNARSGRDLFVLGAVFTALVLGLAGLGPRVTGAGRVQLPTLALSVGTVVVVVRAVRHARRLRAAAGGGAAGGPPAP